MRVIFGIISALGCIVAFGSTAFAGGISVAIYFVDLTGATAPDPKFLACGDPGRAGPFMSAGTAIEWRGEFLDQSLQSPDRIIGAMSTDDGVCTRMPWYHDNEWHQ